MSSKIMYLGAGLHLDPLDHFKTANEFVFVDTLPRSEFDREGIFYEDCFCHDFVNDLIKKCSKKGFILLLDEMLDEQYFIKIMSWYQRWIFLNKVKQTFPYICPTRLTFYNNETNQTLKYYVSTNIDFNSPINSLSTDLSTCDGLIVSGFHPPMCLLYFIYTPLKLFGYSGTVFKLSKEEENRRQTTLVQWIVNETEQNKKISFIVGYFVCNKKTGEIEKCADILDLNSKTIKMIQF
jgi:hypothetical protein